MSGLGVKLFTFLCVLVALASSAKERSGLCKVLESVLFRNQAWCPADNELGNLDHGNMQEGFVTFDIKNN